MMKPATSWAQAEIDPDHFEITNDESVPQVQTNAMPSRNVDNFHGNFTLPFTVRYAGLTLLPGTYSLSVRSLGQENVVTLIPDGDAVRIQPVQTRVSSLPSIAGPSALILERAGQQHVLTAIRLKESGITLNLQAVPRRTASVDTELVPILSAAHKPSGD
jgi:hypothetical protein